MAGELFLEKTLQRSTVVLHICVDLLQKILLQMDTLKNVVFLYLMISGKNILLCYM